MSWILSLGKGFPSLANPENIPCKEVVYHVGEVQSHTILLFNNNNTDISTQEIRSHLKCNHKVYTVHAVVTNKNYIV